MPYRDPVPRPYNGGMDYENTNTNDREQRANWNRPAGVRVVMCVMCAIWLCGVGLLGSSMVGCQERVVRSTAYGSDSAGAARDGQSTQFIVEDINPPTKKRRGFFDKLFGGIKDMGEEEPAKPTKPGYRAY